MLGKIELQLTQIKPLAAPSNDTTDGFYGDGFAPLPEGSLLGLGVRAAHPFFRLLFYPSPSLVASPEAEKACPSGHKPYL